MMSDNIIKENLLKYICSKVANSRYVTDPLLDLIDGKLHIEGDQMLRKKTRTQKFGEYYLGIKINFPTLNREFSIFDLEKTLLSEVDRNLVRSVFQRGARVGSSTLAQRTTLENDLMDLRSWAPVVFDSFQRVFSGIVYFAEASFSTASSPRLFGVLAVGKSYFLQNPRTRLLSLVHEHAHHELFLINLIDNLVNLEVEEEWKFAPYQQRRRPAIGHLHALWALMRMKKVSDEMGENNVDLKLLIEAGARSIPRQKLTSFGNLLIQSGMKSLSAI